MLIPRRVKHRKQHRPDRHGAATGGTEVTFGQYGLMALEHSYVTNRQIESARIAITRHIRRGGRVWINGQPLDEPYLERGVWTASQTYGRKALTIPPEHYLVLGDNRANSIDGRTYGPLGRKSILGALHR